VRIKKEDPGTILEPYTGKPLWSCNKKLTVYGQICLRNCQITGDCLKNVTVIVTNHKSQYECLLGRDLMKKVPNFDVTLTNMEKDIKTSAVNITELHNSMIKTENTIEPSEIHLKEEELHDNNRNIQVELTGKKVETESINFKELMNLSPSNGENLNSTNDLKVSDNFLNSLNVQKENLQMIIETKTDALKPEINSIEHNDNLNEKNWSKTEIETVRKNIMNELKTISAESVTDLTPSKNMDIAFKIELLDPNQTPITTKSRPLPYHLKQKVKDELDRQLKAGIIRKSRSEWSSALRIVDKKDGSIRITVDYKPLNKIIKGDSYPLPSIKDLFNKLSEADVFTRMDIKSAYHQIPVEEESTKYTAFICEFGLFEYLSMPMGIKSAPAWFQRVIEDALKDLIYRKLIDVYIDDSFIFTRCRLFGIMIPLLSKLSR